MNAAATLAAEVSLIVVRDAAGIRLELPATLAAIDAADAQVTRYLTEAGVPVDRFAVRILLREALLNAVIHGSGQDPQKAVRLALTLEPDAVVLTVEDQGPGFAWEERDTTFDIVGDGGRGLALMQTYASSVTFNQRGNCVVLRRRWDQPAATPQN